MKASRLGALGIAALVAIAAGPARADDPLAAEATFAKGRELMKAGSYPEACAAFELSLSLERAVGTQVNLAECYLKLGRTASAWLAYREAASSAQKAGEAPRAAEARDRAAKLEPTLCRLVVRVPSEAPEAMVVRRDGKLVDRQLWGIAVPVDSGPHEIVASLEGAESVRRTAQIRASTSEACADTVVELPALAASLPTPALAPRPTPAVASSAVEPAPSPRLASSGKTQRLIAFSLGGLGLVALGLGSGFAADAISKKNGAACTDAGCTVGGRADMRAAGSSADVTTVAVTSGLVLLAASAIVWITAPAAAKISSTAIRF